MEHNTKLQGLPPRHKMQNALPPPPRIVRLLCVEDNPDDAELIAMALDQPESGITYEIERVDDEKGFTAVLSRGVEVVLCDYNLPQFSPQRALTLMASLGFNEPLIVVTRAIGEEAAVDIMRLGAQDYVTKDRLATLPQVVARALADEAQRRERELLSTELEAAYLRLKEMSSRLVATQERERTVISRELHDVLGQTLTGVVIHLHAAARASEPQAAADFTATAMKMAQEAVGQVKSLSFALRPQQLELLGLEAAMRSAVARIAEPAGLDTNLKVRGTEPKKLGENAEVALRLAQEAATNTVRHANATIIMVCLRFFPDGRIGILVLDDGKGFDVTAAVAGPVTEKNLGLRGMMERTELVGGRMRIRSSPGTGTALRAVL
jgi:signal transduction histidine kinase